MRQRRRGQIDLTLSLGAIQLLLRATMPFIEINGQPSQRPWGRHTYDLWPGEYHVRVWYPYIMEGMAGFATIRTVVQSGYATMLHYETPLLVRLAGTLRETGSRPLAP